MPPAPRRRTIVGVSLKMYFDPEESASWAAEVAAVAKRHPAVVEGSVRLFVLPSLPALPGVIDAIGDAPIEVGAQDLFWEDRGAYTGGISGADLVAVGCRLVEVGHAERRRYFGENDGTVGAKLQAAWRNGLTPVLCVGEREPGDARSAAAACLGQLDSALANRDGTTADGIVVAYEPEWAIGEIESADPRHIAAVATAIRGRLSESAWPGGADVIYGGSAGPELLPRLGGSVDGLFLGRFAHDPAALEATLDDTMGRP